MTYKTRATLNEVELELVRGGMSAPSASARGERPDGDVQLNETGSETGPQSIY